LGANVQREFVETKGFSSDWKTLGQTDEELRGLQTYLAEYPASGPMIEGTGGARKIRWGRGGKQSGKSGGVRILYLDDAADGKIFLVAVFGKDEKDNLSAEEKKAIKIFIKSF